MKCGDKSIGRYSGLSVYIVDFSPSLATRELLASQDYHPIEVLRSRRVGVCEESKPMTFVVEHAAASSELPCLKTVLLKAVILI